MVALRPQASDEAMAMIATMENMKKSLRKRGAKISHREAISNLQRRQDDTERKIHMNKDAAEQATQ